MGDYKVKVVCRKKMLCNDGERQLYYKKGVLYYYEQERLIAKRKMKMSHVKYVMSKLRVLERLLRLVPRLAMPVDKEKILLSYQGHMWEYNTKKYP